MEQQVAPEKTADAPRMALAVRGASKRFGSTQALDGVDIELRRGEVHALVGGNGSGKSTIIKVLAGVYGADDGELSTPDGTFTLADQTPERAKELGLRFVHQDFGIFPILSVADNLALGSGFDTDSLGRIRMRASARNARAVLERFHLDDIDPRAQASSLSAPRQALVAIARALQDIDEDRQAVLFLDEPTAALPAGEAAFVLSYLRELSAGGHAIVLVSHRLDEVREVAQRVTALRDGHQVGTMAAENLTEGNLVELILGTKQLRTANTAETKRAGEPVLDARGLVGGPIRGIDLQVYPGEIVGVAGLLGSGRTELFELLYGARRIEAGEVHFAGQRVRRPSTARMSRMGMAFVPEDRLSGGVIPEHSVGENLTAGHLRRYFQGFGLQRRKLARDVREDLERYEIKAADPSVLIEALSGGNQQKVVLARWLREDPALLLLDEPTQGIDIGARETVLSLMIEATKKGTAVLFASSEFEELIRFSHRIVVLSHGRVAGEVSRGGSAHELLESVLSAGRSVST